MTKQFLVQVEMGDSREMVDAAAIPHMLKRQTERIFELITDGQKPAVKVEQLVDKETFDAAQVMLEENLQRIMRLAAVPK